MLLCQVLNLEFLLIHRAFILQASLLLPLWVKQRAIDWIGPVLLLEAIEVSQETLILSIASKNLVNSCFHNPDNQSIHLRDFFEGLGARNGHIDCFPSDFHGESTTGREVH